MAHGAHRASPTRRSARSASRSAAARSGTPRSSGVPFKAIVPVITWTNLATRARAAGPLEVGPRRSTSRRSCRRAAGTRSSSPRRPALDDEHRPDRGRRARRRALAGREARVDHDADAADPGPPRLPLRHRPGARRVQGAEGPEAALPRRPRPLAGRSRRRPRPTRRSTGARPCKWFDRYLKGTPNGIDKQPSIELGARSVRRQDDDRSRRCRRRRRSRSRCPARRR